MRTLIVMAKNPQSGNVMTRLSDCLSPCERAELSDALLFDALEKATKAADRIFCFMVPNTGNLAERLQMEVSFESQSGSDLGERIVNAVHSVFERGAKKTVVIGTDCPLLEADAIVSVFEALETGRDAVIGPANDGGYYLIGMSANFEFLFDEIQWGGGDVLSDTIEAGKSRGLDLSLLKNLPDLDHPEDLAALFNHFEQLETTAPRTKEWLKKNQAKIES
ncbi:MAG: TIGR04282 family arsenosugar biosynthesis glycosyltransferase [Pyrinomonadaceae bacterium]